MCRNYTYEQLLSTIGDWDLAGGYPSLKFVESPWKDSPVATSRGIPRLAEKLEWLIANIRDIDGSRATAAKIAAWLTEHDVPASASHIANLRQGYRSNPDWRVLDGIATYFGIPNQYWSDESVEQAVRRDVADIAQRWDARRGEIVSKVARLSPEQLAELAQALQRLERGE